MSDQQLVVMDFPGIKKFVFGTDRLVEIRGASALLDELNRFAIPDLLEKKCGLERIRCVFAGGGAGQFVVDGEIEKVREAFENVGGHAHALSGGSLRIVFGMASYGNDFSKSLESAFLDLKKRKNESPFEPCSAVHMGFVRECDSCAGMAAEQSDYGGESRCLCPACRKKEEHGRKRGLWSGFAVHMKMIGGTDPASTWEQRPVDFEEIGDRCAARRGYTALVYGDGNSMGRVVKRIDSEKRYQRFSKAVDEAVREACYEALASQCPPEKGKIPADILLLGGDDLMVYLSADTALPFALEVVRKFEAKTRQKLIVDDKDPFFKDILGDNGMTLSMGIAYGRSHTPVSIMADQAEELLKSAKAKGTALANGEEYTPACIDFHFTGRFNNVGVADCRRQHLTFETSVGETVRLYQGPYTLDEAENLLEHARRLKASGIPNSRLHRLGSAPFLGKIDGTIETLMLYSRCRHSSKKQEKNQKQAIIEALARFECLPVMPWREGPDQTSTVMVDLVEIAELTTLKKKGGQDAPSHSA